jgi:hypothetical protein
MCSHIIISYPYLTLYLFQFFLSIHSFLISLSHNHYAPFLLYLTIQPLSIYFYIHLHIVLNFLFLYLSIQLINQPFVLLKTILPSHLIFILVLSNFLLIVIFCSVQIIMILKQIYSFYYHSGFQLYLKRNFNILLNQFSYFSQ